MRSLYKAAVVTVLVTGTGGYVAGVMSGHEADLPPVQHAVMMPMADEPTGGLGADTDGVTERSGRQPGTRRAGERQPAPADRSGRQVGPPDGRDGSQNSARGTGGQGPPAPAPAPAPAPPPPPPAPGPPPAPAPAPAPAPPLVGLDDDDDDEIELELDDDGDDDDGDDD